MISRTSKIVQNIRQTYNPHHENHDKLESGINGRRKNSSRDENPGQNLLGRLNLTTDFCLSNDATHSITYIGNAQRQEIYKITGKDKPANVYVKRFFPKWKRTGNPNTNNKNIRPGYRNGIWLWKMFHTDKEKWGKRNKGRKKFCLTTKLGKHQKPWREGEWHVLENIGSG